MNVGRTAFAQLIAHHMGFRSRIARSTLADANETHDWRIFADFAQQRIRIARPLHVQDPIGVDLDHTLYALDSTTIDLCLSLFPWAKFRQHKGAVKMHTLLDLHGNIPTFISVTGWSLLSDGPRYVDFELFFKWVKQDSQIDQN